MLRIPLTHKGWFGLCPVYTRGTYGGEPLIVERHWALAPLFMLSEAIFAVCFLAMSVMAPHREPAWPIRITGKLPAGRVVELPVAEG